jgi:hypothetical protein
MPNNLDPVPISVNISPQQLIVVTANIILTINAPAFTNSVGEFFQVLKLKFSIKSSKFFCSSPPSLDRRMKPSRCSIGYSKHHRLGSYPSIFSFIGKYSNTPCVSFATNFCRIWRFVHFAKCVQHF